MRLDFSGVSGCLDQSLRRDPQASNRRLTVLLVEYCIKPEEFFAALWAIADCVRLASPREMKGAHSNLYLATRALCGLGLMHNVGLIIGQSNVCPFLWTCCRTLIWSLDSAAKY
jgi:hypothetical protein